MKPNGPELIAFALLALAFSVIAAVLATWAVWIYRTLRMTYRRRQIRRL